VLNYKDSGKATAGTLSFTASLLSCYSVATGKQLEESISQLYALASNEVSRYFDCYDPVGKSLIFVGEGLQYATSLYACMKQYEVLGSRSLCFELEEFCHSPIFGIQTGSDQVIIFGMSDLSERLLHLLQQAGVTAWLLKSDLPSTSLGAALFGSFFAQVFTLRLAERSGLEECYFVSNKKLLEVSSSMIY
jgi:fructoselysine-6-P-deglycase FrlB-like protein